MRVGAFLAVIMMALGNGIFAGEPLDKPILSEDATQKAQQPKTVRVALANDANDKPTTKFSSDTAKIRAIWNGGGLEAGDKVQALWLAQDVGIDAPKDSKITESAVTAYKPDDDGVFSLAPPKGGWPLGKYRFEIYLNGKLMQAVDFTIVKGATIELGSDSQ